MLPVAYCAPKVPFQRVSALIKLLLDGPMLIGAWQLLVFTGLQAYPITKCLFSTPSNSNNYSMIFRLSSCCVH